MLTSELFTMATPVRNWLIQLEKHYILHPSLIVENGDKFKYKIKSALIDFYYVFVISLYYIGSIYPELGLRLGNIFNALGFAGQFTSIGCGSAIFVVLFLRLSFRKLKHQKFLSDLLVYDGKHVHKQLRGEYRKKFISELNVLPMVKVFVCLNVIVAFFMALLLCFAGIIQLGLTLEHVLICSIASVHVFVIAWLVLSEHVYCFGLWYLCKRHLDLQMDAFIDYVNRKNIDHCNIDLIANRYDDLIKHVKYFDSFSKNIIGPYRPMATFVFGISFYGATLFENRALGTILDVGIILAFIACMAALSTSSSLTNRRRIFYRNVNMIFSNYLKKEHSWRELICLNRMIKSSGNTWKPTICLTDTTGQEFDSMEFVKFVGECVSMYCLAAKLHRTQLGL